MKIKIAILIVIISIFSLTDNKVFAYTRYAGQITGVNYLPDQSLPFTSLVYATSSPLLVDPTQCQQFPSFPSFNIPIYNTSGNNLIDGSSYGIIGTTVPPSGVDLSVGTWYLYFFASHSPSINPTLCTGVNGFDIISSGQVQDATRFISLLPVASTTVATSSPTTIGATLFIRDEDFVSGMFLDLSFSNQTVTYAGGSALDAFSSAFGGNRGSPFRFPLVAGINTISTSTTFTTTGVTVGDYRVISPSFLSTISLGLINPDVLIASSTTFTVVQKTGLDIALESNGQNLVSALITGTTTLPVLQCDPNPVTFNLTLCLISVIVPPSPVLKADLEELKSNSPFGWLYRVVSLMASQATSTLPVLSYTFPVSRGPMSGMTIEFDTGEYMTRASNFVNNEAMSDVTGDQKSVWEILQPIVDLLIYLVLFFAMFHDLSGIKLHRNEK